MSDVAQQLPGQEKRWPLIAVAITVVALACIIGGPWLRPGQVAVVPFLDAAELQAALNGLPIIGLSEPPVEKAVWRQYETAAFRVNATSPDIVKPALSQLVNEPNREFFSDAKPMILLRVCFEIPKSRTRVPEVTQGWFGPSASAQWRPGSYDLAWPVGRRFGSFYLKDHLEGYRGRNYDPVMEYEWMLAHCEKRKR